MARPEAYSPEAALRKRFGVTVQLYAMRRESDQGVGDFSTLALAAEAAGGAGAAYFGVSPMHMLFPCDRERASPYHPSDRRFLDPILIDVLDAALPREEAIDATLGALAPAIAAAAATKLVDYQAVWTIKRAALEACHAAFARVRAARPRDAIVEDYDAFVRAGGDALRRFAAFEAIAAGPSGANWRSWPSALRDGESKAIEAMIAGEPRIFDFALYCQWLADSQLKRAAARARAAGLEIGFYRDLAVGAAPDGAEAWAHAGELAQGVTIGAPPDPFSTEGQNWNLPAPTRSRALARAGRLCVRSPRPTCAMPECCGSTMRWACSGSFSSPREQGPRKGRILPIRSTISSATSRSKANERNAW